MSGGPPVFDYLAPSDAGSEIVMFGELNRPYRIFESSDLQNWSLMTTLSSANGTIFLDDPNVETQRFYRSVSP